MRILITYLNMRISLSVYYWCSNYWLSKPLLCFRGLDSSSTSSCVQLLKDLAREGRTVVCTIHQPSALVFEKFDHLYAVAGGHCVYHGSIPQLVPHLATVGLVCPRSHNPADFRESLCDYPPLLSTLVLFMVICVFFFSSLF